MNYPRSLLMPLSTSGHVSERIAGALSVAAFFKAHLEVLHAQVSPKQFLPNDVVGMPSHLLHELEQLADKHSESESCKLKTMFARMCEERQVVINELAQNDVATAHWQEVNGLRSELVAERGKVADLIVFPQSKTGKPTATFEAAIMRSGKPVLVMPRTQTQFAASRVLIAWNGSTEAARAITHALPILTKAEKVVIATGLQSVHRKPGPEDLKSYLSQHSIDAEITSFDKRQGSTGETLLSLAKANGSDLLVMGGFTHRRLHEQIFGGVTQHVLASAEIPIFMMH